MPWLLAPLYDRFMARTEAACLGAWRAELLASAVGRVVEIGAGTGANLAHYGDDPAELFLCEPDAGMRRQLVGRAGDDARIRVLDAGAEELPFPDQSVDSVVSTLVLCTVPDPVAALAEVRRVLRPGGALLFLEHVAAEPGTPESRHQRWLEPVWGCVAGGCCLTRETESMIRAAGLQPGSVVRAPMKPAPRFIRPTIRGVARR